MEIRFQLHLAVTRSLDNGMLREGRKTIDEDEVEMDADNVQNTLKSSAIPTKSCFYSAFYPYQVLRHILQLIPMSRS